MLQLAEHRPWTLWCGFLALLVATALPSLSTSPPIWRDEVQIVDFGRVLLTGDAGPAVSYHLAEQRPLMGTGYVGCVLAELMTRLFGGPTGSRLMGLLSAVALASLLFMGLLDSARGGMARWMLLLLCGALLYEPTFSQSYRGARVDALALVPVVGAWLLMQRWMLRRKAILPLLAGALLCLSFFIWPRALIAWPLVMLPFARSEEPFSWAFVLRSAWLGVLGVALMLALIVWPGIAGCRDVLLAADSPTGAIPWGERMGLAWHDVWQMPRPHLPLNAVALLGLATLILSWRRRPWFGNAVMGVFVLSTLLLLAWMATPLHHFNVIYTLPAMLVLAWEGWLMLGGWPRARGGALALVVLMFVCNFGMNGVMRNVAARQRGATSITPVEMATLVQPGDRVFTLNAGQYFALRELGIIPYSAVVGTEGVEMPMVLERLRIDVLVVPSKARTVDWWLSRFEPAASSKRLASNGDIYLRLKKP